MIPREDKVLGRGHVRQMVEDEVVDWGETFKRQGLGGWDVRKCW